MGLDMYAWAVDAKAVPEEKMVDVSLGEAKEKGFVLRELHYWRKHHDLHGWMEGLYREKGGTDPDFNCNTLRLLPEDLDELEKAVKEEGSVLPVTTGFFFGNCPPDDESRADDLKFIADARKAIADGQAVFYDSWW